DLVAQHHDVAGPIRIVGPRLPAHCVTPELECFYRADRHHPMISSASRTLRTKPPRPPIDSMKRMKASCLASRLSLAALAHFSRLHSIAKGRPSMVKPQ